MLVLWWAAAVVVMHVKGDIRVLVMADGLWWGVVSLVPTAPMIKLRLRQ